MSDTITAADRTPYFITPIAPFVVIVIFIINGGIHNNHNSNNIVWFATFPNKVVGYFLHYVGILILTVTFRRPYRMAACSQRAVLGGLDLPHVCICYMEDSVGPALHPNHCMKPHYN